MLKVSLNSVDQDRQILKKCKLDSERVVHVRL